METIESLQARIAALEKRIAWMESLALKKYALGMWSFDYMAYFLGMRHDDLWDMLEEKGIDVNDEITGEE